MQDENQLTEDSMRQALERFGSGKKKETSFKMSSSGERFSQDAAHKALFKSGSQNEGKRQNFTPRKRRFVEDDAVIVEHHSSLRASQKTHSSQGRSKLEGAQEIYELKQILRQEQRKLREAQEETKEFQQKTRSLETRIAHYHLQVEELGRQLTVQQNETLRLRTELRDLQDRQAQSSQKDPKKENIPSIDEALPLRRRRGRPPKNRALLEYRQNISEFASMKQGPQKDDQPFQWWREE